ncbi:MAG: type II toxin-antitoxin system VapC family toxin [Hymenobacter sp.]|nr:type II toxin-antitoxin system VapC family toxin [Hymenobacter sp.]
MAYLLDTDVLIDFLRGRAEAAAFLDSLIEPPFISVITVAELYAGVREGAERAALQQLISAANVLPLDEAVATAGGLWRRQYGRSHNVGLNDALIAATAENCQATLATLNVKHFPMLATVLSPYQKP